MTDHPCAYQWFLCTEGTIIRRFLTWYFILMIPYICPRGHSEYTIQSNVIAPAQSINVNAIRGDFTMGSVMIFAGLTQWLVYLSLLWYIEALPVFMSSCATFYKHGLTLIPAWISNYIQYKMWDEIIYPFPNVWEWISNFIPYFTGTVITYPCQD